MILQFKKLLDDAYAPTKAFPEDAGWDIRSRERFVIMPGERIKVATGLALGNIVSEGLGLPDWLSLYWRVADKSGLADSKGVHVLGGVVDRNYRGELGVILANLGFFTGGQMGTPVAFDRGDKICQIVPEVILRIASALEVSELDATDRGHGGFGSTGA